MNLLMQWLVVALLVAGAAFFATWRLLAPRLRLAALATLLKLLPATSTGLVARWRASVARRIAADAARGSGCAPCSKH